MILYLSLIFNATKIIKMTLKFTTQILRFETKNWEIKGTMIWRMQIILRVIGLRR